MAWGSAASKAAHADSAGCYATNDILAESVFGALGEYLRQFRGCHISNASGVVQVRMNGDFERAGGLPTKKRRRKERDAPPAQAPDAEAPLPRRSTRHKGADGAATADRRDDDNSSDGEAPPSIRDGAFHGLNLNMKISLIEFSRCDYEESRRLAGEAQQRHDDYYQKKRDANRDKSMQRLAELHQKATEFFEESEQRRRSITDVKKDLKGLSDPQQIAYLKKAIQIRVVGYGWSDLHVPWSKGGVAKKPHELLDALKRIIAEELKREVPSEAPFQMLPRKTLKHLGAPIAQFQALVAKREAVDEARRREILAETERDKDSKGDLSTKQPPRAPRVNSKLVGTRIQYLDKIDADGKETHWFPGVITEFSDGSVAKGGRSTKNWPDGFVCIEFDAQPALGWEEETVMWAPLRLSKFNGSTVNAWRLDWDSL